MTALAAIARRGRRRRRSTRTGADGRDDGPLRSVSIAMGVLGCFEREAELGATRVAARARRREEHRVPDARGAGGGRACWSAPATGRYRLGLRLFEIGQLAVDRLMLRELAAAGAR